MAGMKKVIVPKENRPDVEELEEEITEESPFSMQTG